jgi:hypothetical protein
MRMRGLLALLLVLVTALACVSVKAQSVPWPVFGPVRNLLRFDGFTDTVPDFVGPIDGSAELTIFTEGNHYPVLLPLVLQRFPEWCRANHACEADAARILVVTLPQPMVVRMLTEGGISLGNAVLPIGRDKPVFPDLVMGGVAPLRQLRAAGVVEGQARIFAHTLGMGLLVSKALTGHRRSRTVLATDQQAHRCQPQRAGRAPAISRNLGGAARRAGDGAAVRPRSRVVWRAARHPAPRRALRSDQRPRRWRADLQPSRKFLCRRLS